MWKDLRKRLGEVTPDCISRSIVDDCEYFDVTAATPKEAKQKMHEFGEQFKELSKECTSSPSKLEEYGTLIYIAYFYA